jgi:CRP-like cAMP-binding protein
MDATRHHLGEAPLFAELSDAVLGQLAHESRVRHYPEGQILCSEGDPGDSLLVVEEGTVRVSRFSASGQEVVLAVVDAPAAIGELALIDGQPRSATVTARSAVVVRVVPRRAVAALMHSEPSVALAMLRGLAAVVRASNERLADVLSLDVQGRVAKWLLARAETHGTRRDGAIVIETGASQGELALELGATRVSINKALKSFERLGAIAVGRTEIVLRAPDLLADYIY